MSHGLQSLLIIFLWEVFQGKNIRTLFFFKKKEQVFQMIDSLALNSLDKASLICYTDRNTSLGYALWTLRKKAQALATRCSSVSSFFSFIILFFLVAIKVRLLHQRPGKKFEGP